LLPSKKVERLLRANDQSKTRYEQYLNKYQPIKIIERKISYVAKSKKSAVKEKHNAQEHKQPPKSREGYANFCEDVRKLNIWQDWEIF
jgi:hypothetical protein